MVPYYRELYGEWTDADGDCQNTRQEVLIQESTIPVTLNRKGCKVLSGRWEDPYTGKVFTDPRDLEIDHFIPLAEVHRSGGSHCFYSKRQEYANDLYDPRTLIAVFGPTSRSKGDRGPANWLPPNKDYRCEYMRTWVALKKYWDLLMDKREEEFLNQELTSCTLKVK